ncbi:hypothetical protein [Pseudolysinimonas sp.]|uniref:hypothetical protein n=1 Tax=Pseudolysinimonas sp. TaxID=2680009 RepID=UPI00286CA554|nr:hypothetical protein [Pseudolysinimonas sp.]
MDDRDTVGYPDVCPGVVESPGAVAPQSSQAGQSTANPRGSDDIRRRRRGAVPPAADAGQCTTREGAANIRPT